MRRRDGLHHLLRRGPLGRGAWTPARTRREVRTAGGLETIDTIDRRRRCTPATSCSSTPAPPSPCWRRSGAMPEGHRLPLPVHRGRRARRRPAARRPGPLGRGQGERPALALRTVDAGPAPGTTIEAAADAMAAAFAAGGRLFTFGNGGSSTDAASLAALFARPPWGRPLPARSLVDDPAVLTALATTSASTSCSPASSSPTPRRATSPSASRPAAARATCWRRSPRPVVRGLLTVGLAGYDGGEMATSADVEHCLVVPLGQRPPDPGDPGRAGLRPVGGGPAHSWERTAWVSPTGDRATKRPCSSGSRPSAGAGPGSPTTSSRWPTAPAARRRRPWSTPSSSTPFADGRRARRPWPTPPR